MRSLHDVLRDVTSTPFEIVTVLDHHLDQVWHFCEPETLWMEIEDATAQQGDILKFDDIPRAMKNKIMAIRVCFNSLAPWQDWAVFPNICLALSGVTPEPDSLLTPEPSSIVRCVEFMRTIEPKNQFEGEVAAMIAVLLYKEGFLWLPGYLGALVNTPLRKLLAAATAGNGPEEDADSIVLDMIMGYMRATYGKETDWLIEEEPVAVHTVKVLALEHAANDAKRYWPREQPQGK
jgi:hypothetical protein